MKNIRIIKILLFLFAFLSISTGATSQSKNNTFSQMISVGLYLGIDYPFIHSFDGFPENIDIENALGLSGGIKAEYLIKEHTFLSTSVGINTKKSKIIFSYPNDFKLDYYIRQANFDFGLELIMKNLRKDYLPYLIFGGSLDVPIEGVYDDHDYFPMKTSFSVVPGIGYEIKKDKNSLSAELRYSIGINNINTHPELKSINITSWTLLFICSDLIPDRLKQL